MVGVLLSDSANYRDLKQKQMLRDEIKKISGGGLPMKILGIDDDDEINELLDTVLNARGYDYVFANNGRDGLKLIREKKFDVVLLDIAMPQFSGRDVIDALVKENLINKQTVIIFSASDISELEIDAMKVQGVYSCLRKPIGMDTLVATLDKL